jgi:hypothetical protein
VGLIAKSFEQRVVLILEKVLRSPNDVPSSMPLDRARSRLMSTIPMPLDAARCRSVPLDAARSRSVPLDAARSRSMPLDAARCRSMPLDAAEAIASRIRVNRFAFALPL